MAEVTHADECRHTDYQRGSALTDGCTCGAQERESALRADVARLERERDEARKAAEWWKEVHAETAEARATAERERAEARAKADHNEKAHRYWMQTADDAAERMRQAHALVEKDTASHVKGCPCGGCSALALLATEAPAEAAQRSEPVEVALKRQTAQDHYNRVRDRVHDSGHDNDCGMFDSERGDCDCSQSLARDSLDWLKERAERAEAAQPQGEADPFDDWESDMPKARARAPKPAAQPQGEVCGNCAGYGWTRTVGATCCDCGGSGRARSTKTEGA